MYVSRSRTFYLRIRRKPVENSTTSSASAFLRRPRPSRLRNLPHKACQAVFAMPTYKETALAKGMLCAYAALNTTGLLHIPLLFSASWLRSSRCRPD